MKPFEKVVCADGFAMSVQAGERWYCAPRLDNAKVYRLVEVGYPNRLEPMLLHYAEQPDTPESTVYGFVPASLVSLVIAKHGGIIAGELPPGIPILPGSTRPPHSDK